MRGKAQAVFFAALGVLFVGLTVTGVLFAHSLNAHSAGVSVWGLLPRTAAFAFIACAMIGFIGWMIFGALLGGERGFRAESRPGRRHARWPFLLLIVLFVLMSDSLLMLLLYLIAALALLLPLVFFGIAVFGLITGRLPRRVQFPLARKGSVE